MPKYHESPDVINGCVQPIAPGLKFDMSASAYRVLFWLNAHQNKYMNGCVIGVTQTKAAKALGMSQATVSRALAELAGADAVRREHLGLWIINPDYMICGLVPDEEHPYRVEMASVIRFPAVA